MTFVSFVLYTIVCIADGPDVKPLWKRWLGKKLEKASNHFYPIEYFPFQPVYVEKSTFDAVPIKSRMMLSEGEIFEARRYQEMMREHGVPDWQIPRNKNVSYLVERAKEICVRNILDEARQFVDVEVDEEREWPGIIITAKMLVGKRKVEL